jgi:hypothetical protein
MDSRKRSQKRVHFNPNVDVYITREIDSMQLPVIVMKAFSSVRSSKGTHTLVLNPDTQKFATKHTPVSI